MKIAPIFKDEVLQKTFEEEGYVKVPLIDEATIDKLTKLFYKFHTSIEENNFSASTFSTDRALKLAIRDTLYPIFLPFFEKYFTEYTYFGSSFLYKTPGKNSDLAPHQDWTIVDEKKYVAVNIWTPLVDTNPQNGTLYVLPKSHAQKIFSLRAPTIAFFFQNYFDTVKKCSIPTNAKAGEAVILNQSLIHYSSSNISEDIRIAITSGVKTKNAPMLFHYKNNNEEIEKYQMPEDFLLNFPDFHTSIYQRPENGQFIEKVQAKVPQLSKFKFLQNFAQNRLSFVAQIREMLG